MKPLTLHDLLPPDRFAELRPSLRDAVIAHKRDRRIAVGDRVTMVFEDRETLRWQVQEMCRVEQLRAPAQVQQELDVYNQLMPGEGELSATLFVEITDSARIRAELDRLIGIDEHVSLHVGDEVVPARFDPKQLEEERISAVQYLRFRLTPEQIARFSDPAVPLRLAVDHPHYAAEALLDAASRRSLALDLRGGAPPLLDPGGAAQPLFDPRAAARPESADRVLREHGRARAVAPGGAPPGLVVVSARDGEAGFLDADPQTASDLLALAREVARELTAAHGGCAVRFDAARRPWRIELQGT